MIEYHLVVVEGLMLEESEGRLSCVLEGSDDSAEVFGSLILLSASNQWLLYAMKVKVNPRSRRALRNIMPYGFCLSSFFSIISLRKPISSQMRFKSIMPNIKVIANIR